MRRIVQGKGAQEIEREKYAQYEHLGAERVKEIKQYDRDMGNLRSTIALLAWSFSQGRRE
jgi:hypothetical protein